MAEETKAPKPYRTPKGARTPIHFEAKLYDGDDELVALPCTAKHLRYHQFAALDDYLVGEIKEGADPTGEQEIKARRIKLQKVLLSVENLDPGEFSGGRLDAGPHLDRFIYDDANADFVWAAWRGYWEVVVDPSRKSRVPVALDRGGETEEAPRDDAAAA